MQTERTTKTEEESILLRDFKSAADLKNEIASRVLSRSKSRWQFVRLASRGSFLYLLFEQPYPRA